MPTLDDLDGDKPEQAGDAASGLISEPNWHEGAVEQESAGADHIEPTLDEPDETVAELTDAEIGADDALNTRPAEGDESPSPTDIIAEAHAPTPEPDASALEDGESAATDEVDPLTRFDLSDALRYEFATDMGEEVAAAASSAPPEAAVAPAEPEFVRRDRQRAFWRSTPVRLLLGLLVLLLSVALAGQAAWFWRNDIAQQWPQARPYLEQLCVATTGCTITAPRDLQALVIDTSSLSPSDTPSDLVLRVLLRNQALTGAAAYPALELTLTDLQGVIRARKVLLPEQYLPQQLDTPAARDAGLAAGQQLAVQVHLQVKGEAPAGYRVVAFYP